MPKFCNNKEEAEAVVKAMGESQFPCMIEVWTAHDVKSVHTNSDDQQLLDDEQADEVLRALTSDYDACLGMNWDVIDCEVNRRFPICNDCEKLEADCECEGEIPDFHDTAVGAAIGDSGMEIQGWTPSWEYPGFIEWTHPDYRIRVLATPWWESTDQVPVHFADDSGAAFGDGWSFELKPTGDVEADVAAYRKVMEENWDMLMEKLKSHDPEKCPKCGKLDHPDSLKLRNGICYQCACEAAEKDE